LTPAGATGLSDDISTTIHESPDELPPNIGHHEWAVCSFALEPSRVIRNSRDRRFSTSFVLARVDTRPVGFLPLLRYKAETFPASMFDPASTAPRVFTPDSRPAHQYMLVGGTTELVSGAAVRNGLPGQTAEVVRHRLIDAGFEAARAAGLHGAALYVRQAELAAYLGRGPEPRKHQSTGELATLHVPADGLNGYLASLNHGRRSTVLRDWRRLDTLGLHAEEVCARNVVDEAVPLVLGIKHRHNVPDHRILARYRLKDWATDPVGDRVAFVLRDSSGAMIGVTFGCRRPPILELYEIGLVDEPEMRHLIYAEILVYAPLRSAAINGCNQILLGLGSTTPKKIRGATIANVWAVGASTT
jgi:hypothetical protein